MARARLLPLLFCLGLAGCYPAGENAADYGPFPHDYEQIVETWLHGHVYNGPTIRHLRMTKPSRGSVWVGKLYGGAAYGWKTCVAYDVQDRDGKYKGIKRYTMLLRDDAVAYAGVWPLVDEGCDW